MEPQYLFSYEKTPRVGLEPTTTRLTAECSTIELSRKISCFISYLRECCAFSKSYKAKCEEIFIPSKPNTETHLYILTYILFPIQNLWSSPRPISKCQLNTLLCLHLIPIYLVVFKGSYSFKEGNLILESVSHLDAFSAYPVRSQLSSCATGVTTGAP